MTRGLHEQIKSTSYLEHAFLRWVLTPACLPAVASIVSTQHLVESSGRKYYADYVLMGTAIKIAVELDGFAYHSHRSAFTYDRLRQNDLQTAGYQVLRFSYDSVRLHTDRCIEQLQRFMSQDALLQELINPKPVIVPPDMAADPMFALRPSPIEEIRLHSYFDTVKESINRKTLRDCQREAFFALGNYFGGGGRNAACIMSVGAGKTALGITASLAFAKRRALIVTPGSVIRSTFADALDHHNPRNALYNLPGGPLIPGCRPPNVLTLSRDEGPIRGVSRSDLLKADIIITNFHSLGTGEDSDDLLSKLQPDDIDLIVVDEAHIAAADSYQRAFAHFTEAKTLLMSACFQRLDGKPIEADIVYRYRLIDSIADGNAKNLRITRFEPDPISSLYEIRWPDGAREEIRGREALLELLGDERKLAHVTAKSTDPIRRMMETVKQALTKQEELLYPVKPRVLFSALGKRHAEQITSIANDYGIPTDYLHHHMTDSRIRSVKQRFEQDSGDLQGVVQLKMLGQGYDLPSISVVVPLRPYGSFSEFYQFVGRGIRTIHHPSLKGRVALSEQYVDVVMHAELGLDDHIRTIYEENDMDPNTEHILPEDWKASTDVEMMPGSKGQGSADHPDLFVLFERGDLKQNVVHDAERIKKRQAERAEEALTQRYAEYAQRTEEPVSFEQFKAIFREATS